MAQAEEQMRRMLRKMTIGEGMPDDGHHPRDARATGYCNKRPLLSGCESRATKRPKDLDALVALAFEYARCKLAFLAAPNEKAQTRLVRLVADHGIGPRPFDARQRQKDELPGQIFHRLVKRDIEQTNLRRQQALEHQPTGTNGARRLIGREERRIQLDLQRTGCRCLAQQNLSRTAADSRARRLRPQIADRAGHDRRFAVAASPRPAFVRKADPLHQSGMKKPLAGFDCKGSSFAFSINDLNQHHVVTTTWLPSTWTS